VDTLARPDRVLVYDFAVVPDELGKGGRDAQASSTGPEAQTKEHIRVGEAFAKALTANLLQELRNRGIDAYRPTESAPPGPNTASINGRFLRVSQRDGSTLIGFGLGTSQLRTYIRIFQGTGFNLRLVAEAESTTRSNLKSGLDPMLESKLEADAKQTAAQVAERVADYYKRHGWIK
jgi:hypothetical protein